MSDLAPASEEFARWHAEVIAEIRTLIDAYCRGLFTEARFVTSLLDIEAKTAGVPGVILTASNTIDDRTVIRFHVRSRPDLSVDFEFQPESGRVRPSDNLSAPSPNARPKKTVRKKRRPALLKVA